MNATVIDTLRFADRLKEAGFEAPHAEGMARALGDELAERMLTRNDLDKALRPIYARLDAMDARFDGIDGKFVGVDARFRAMDARFDAMDARFDAMDARFDAMDAKIDAMDTKIDAMDTKIDAMDTKIDSVHRELSSKLNMLVGVMALGFTLLVGLSGYNAVSPRFAQPTMQPPQTQQEVTELPGTPSSRPLAEG